MLNRDKAASLLRHAADLVSGPRSLTHDPEGKQMDIAAKMITAFLGVEVTASDVCFIQSIIKMSRAKVGDTAHEDHYVDAAAYCAMAGAMEGDDIEGKKYIFEWDPETRTTSCEPKGFDPREPEQTPDRECSLSYKAKGLDMRSGTKEQIFATPLRHHDSCRCPNCRSAK